MGMKPYQGISVSQHPPHAANSGTQTFHDAATMRLSKKVRPIHDTGCRRSAASATACRSRTRSGRLLPLPRNLRVCTMSADFWGLPTAGGTATAYGLLTSALSEDTSLDVSSALLPSAPLLPDVLCMQQASWERDIQHG